MSGDGGQAGAGRGGGGGGGGGGGAHRQILTRLSHPPVTRRMGCKAAPVGDAAERTAPAGKAGAHETALQPILCALNRLTVQLSSAWRVRTLTRPSEDAHARQRPCSTGHHAIELTEPSCSRHWYTCPHWPGVCSFHTKI